MAAPHEVRPRQLLFAMFQGGGNIPLILPIVACLTAKGHNVRVLAGSGIRRSRLPLSSRFREGIAAAGATLILLDEPSPHPLDLAPPVRGLLRGWEPHRVSGTVSEARITLWSPTWAEQTRRELARARPDVLVADFCLPGALAAAEAAGVPSATLVHTVSWRPLPGQPPPRLGLAPARSPRDRLRDWLGTAVITRINDRDGLPAHNRARAALGLPPLRSWFAQYDAADRVLVLMSQAFDFPAQRLAPNVRYVGTPFDDTDVPVTAWTSQWAADDGRPIVLVSLSTLAQGQAPLLHRILAALAELPVRAVVTFGPSLDPTQFTAVENVQFETFVPHAAILPQVAAVVTQCGMGTLMKALAQGVPLVCLPLVGDQPDNAARIVAHGAGIRLPSDAPIEEIGRAIRQVLDEPGFRAGAQRLATALARDDGAEQAAQELTALATGRQGGR